MLARPEAVNVSNVAALVDSEGKPHFKYIVEGANLFFTQQARLNLEKRKVCLFKDSSANKGMLLWSLLGAFLLSNISAHRWRDQFITRGARRSRAIHGGIRRPHDVQRRQAERFLSELCQGHSREDH